MLKRGIILLLIAVVFIAVCLKPMDGLAYEPESRSEDWWLERHEAKLTEFKALDVELLMIGDSITHRWETDGKAIWDQYYAPRNAANIGFSGDRTEHVLWRIQNGELENISPKLVVLLIGTNNTGQRLDSAEETSRGIKAIIEEVQKMLPNSKILLLALFPRDTEAGGVMRNLNIEVNESISAYHDEEGIYYLDLKDSFLDENDRLPLEIMPDGLHLSSEGYKIWAEAMEPTLRKLFN